MLVWTIRSSSCAPPSSTQTRMNALAKPKKSMKKAFAKEEDAKECTFRPKLKKKPVRAEGEDKDAVLWRVKHGVERATLQAAVAHAHTQ